MLTKKPLVLIAGPTGVGKSNLAESLAQHMPAEIVNMDLGQLYTPLSIGTAKPEWRKAAVPHHLFDIIDSPINYSVTDYRAEFIRTITTIWENNKIPIGVGGSLFYAKSLFFPPNAPSVTRDYTIDPDTAWDELNAVDPIRAASLTKNDLFRITRALAIWHSTGKKPSEFSLDYCPPTDNYTAIFLTRDRKELYNRINERVMIMMQQGWLDEVRVLKGTTWEPFLLEKKLIGYNELLGYLDADSAPDTLNVVIEAIAKRTRNYAKRQCTFWNMLQRQLKLAIEQHTTTMVKPDVELINLTSVNFDLYIKHLSKKVLERA